ncbi:hypothetical protein CYMTET_20473 [Cymbomonas tetramitiformis]|uniref:Uncharacterized protein n=1 Tax=Cymbomonas tetramitiformis TaxID=36881 RepID=A0AAE0G5C0_9CHLO|nr:hypothetical protein CYMTET_20473 [Cymbomonas tetramitiformis]
MASFPVQLPAGVAPGTMFRAVIPPGYSGAGETMMAVAPPDTMVGSIIYVRIPAPQVQVQPNTIISTLSGNYAASYNLQSAQAQAQAHVELETARTVGAQIVAEGGKQVALANSVARANSLSTDQAHYVQAGAIRGQVDFNMSEKESKFENTFQGRTLEACVQEIVDWTQQQTNNFELALPTTFRTKIINALKKQNVTETDGESQHNSRSGSRGL